LQPFLKRCPSDRQGDVQTVSHIKKGHFSLNATDYS